MLVEDLAYMDLWIGVLLKEDASPFASLPPIFLERSGNQLEIKT